MFLLFQQDDFQSQFSPLDCLGCRNIIAATPVDAIDSGAVIRQLQSLADVGVNLCRRSQRLIVAGDSSTADAYISAWRGRPVVNPPFITAIATLPLKLRGPLDAAKSPHWRAPSTLVVATESQHVVMLNNMSFKVDQQWYMDGVPSLLCTHGALLEARNTTYMYNVLPLCIIIHTSQHHGHCMNACCVSYSYGWWAGDCQHHLNSMLGQQGTLETMSSLSGHIHHESERFCASHREV